MIISKVFVAVSVNRSACSFTRELIGMATDFYEARELCEKRAREDGKGITNRSYIDRDANYAEGRLIYTPFVLTDKDSGAVIEYNIEVLGVENLR